MISEGHVLAGFEQHATGLRAWYGFTKEDKTQFYYVNTKKINAEGKKDNGRSLKENMSEMRAPNKCKDALPVDLLPVPAAAAPAAAPTTAAPTTAAPAAAPAAAPTAA